MADPTPTYSPYKTLKQKRADRNRDQWDDEISSTQSFRENAGGTDAETTLAIRKPAPTRASAEHMDVRDAKQARIANSQGTKRDLSPSESPWDHPRITRNHSASSSSGAPPPSRVNMTPAPKAAGHDEARYKTKAWPSSPYPVYWDGAWE